MFEHSQSRNRLPRSQFFPTFVVYPEETIMVKAIFRLIFRLYGWKLNPNLPAEVFQNCVVTAAPHTALRDAVFMIGAFSIGKIPARFAVRKESNTFLLGKILESAGGLWIDRGPRKPGEERRSYLDVMKELFVKNNPTAMIIAPEGTRSLVEEWKSGFYYLAKAANVPIGLGYLDFEKKEAGVGKIIYPSDDIVADMRAIMAFYKDIKGKRPDQFMLDHRYAP